MTRRKITEQIACRERMRKIIRVGPPDKVLDDLLHEINHKETIILVFRKEENDYNGVRYLRDNNL